MRKILIVMMLVLSLVMFASCNIGGWQDNVNDAIDDMNKTYELWDMKINSYQFVDSFEKNMGIGSVTVKPQEEENKFLETKLTLTNKTKGALTLGSDTDAYLYLAENLKARTEESRDAMSSTTFDPEESVDFTWYFEVPAGADLSDAYIMLSTPFKQGETIRYIIAR